MSKETINGICLMIDKLLENKNYKNLIISWFGGEPLLNSRLILEASMKIAKMCENRHVCYSGNMTTNGYLLNEKIFESLLKAGINDYQITVDGNEDTHDNNRPTLNGNKTWNIIITNLKKIKNLSEDYNISIRINCNYENIEESLEFLRYIKENFNDQRFNVRINPIVYMGGQINPKAVFCGTIDADAIQICLYEYLINLNLNTDIFIQQTNPFGLICGAGNINNFVINYDGSVYKCEVKLEEKYRIGKITEDGNFLIDFMKEYHYIIPGCYDKCKICDIYPLCYGLGCPIRLIDNESCDDKVYLIKEKIKLACNYYNRKNNS